MNQRTDSAYTCLHRFWLRSLLGKSLSWLSVFSLLGSIFVLAQTEAKATTNSAADGNGAHIDATAYNIGATWGYSNPK